MLWFASPLWMWGLLPWGAALLWLLHGRAPVARVPFLPLWSSRHPTATRSRRWRRPNAFILLLLTAALLALLAAEGPTLPALNAQLTVVFDCGDTMSPTPPAPAFRGVLQTARQTLLPLVGDSPLTLIAVPGGTIHTTVRSLPSLAARLEPTALPTSGQLQQTLLQRLAEPDGPVVLLSDQSPPAAQNPRILVIRPAFPPVDIGITALAARVGTSPQVMVRLRNGSAQTSANIRLSGPHWTAAHRVQLPPIGQQRSYFFPLPASSEYVQAQVEGNEQVWADDTAFAVRQNDWPKLQCLDGLPPPLQRMAAVYTQRRPPTDDSPALTLSVHPLPADTPGVWLSSTESRDTTTRAAPATIASHPLTAHVLDWPAASASADLPAGTTAVVSRAGVPLVAEREAAGARQTWVNLDLQSWSQQPAFVIFWSNVFDWVGHAEQPIFTHQPPHQLPADDTRIAGVPPPLAQAGLWPGIFRDAHGHGLAIATEGVDWPPASTADGQARSPSQRLRNQFGGYPLAGPLCLAATVAVLLALVSLILPPRRPAILAHA